MEYDSSKPTVIKNDNGREMLYCQNPACKAILHDKHTQLAMPHP